MLLEYMHRNGKHVSSFPDQSQTRNGSSPKNNGNYIISDIYKRTAAFFIRFFMTLIYLFFFILNWKRQTQKISKVSSNNEAHQVTRDGG